MFYGISRNYSKYSIECPLYCSPIIMEFHTAMENGCQISDCPLSRSLVVIDTTHYTEHRAGEYRSKRALKAHMFAQAFKHVC